MAGRADLMGEQGAHWLAEGDRPREGRAYWLVGCDTLERHVTSRASGCSLGVTSVGVSAHWLSG